MRWIEDFCLFHYLDQTSPFVSAVQALQASCKQWNKAREGRVTASKVYDVSKTNLSNPSKSLLQQVAYPTDCAFRSKATDWGIKHEGAAIRRFKQYMKEANLHTNFEIHGAGLYVCPSHGYLAATPDGIFKCACHEDAVMEMKCPYSHRNNTSGEAATPDTKFCLTVDDNGILQLKRCQPYFYQVQLQMLVCELKRCFFCIYTLKDFGCFLINFQEEFVYETLVSKSKLYILQVVLPLKSK